MVILCTSPPPRGGDASGEGAKEGKKLRSGEEKPAGNMSVVVNYNTKQQ